MPSKWISPSVLGDAGLEKEVKARDTDWEVNSKTAGEKQGRKQDHKMRKYERNEKWTNTYKCP